MTGLVFVLMPVVLYFLPTIIAAHRKAKDRSAIGVLNLFLGRTFVGWVVALEWAVRE